MGTLCRRSAAIDVLDEITTEGRADTGRDHDAQSVQGHRGAILSLGTICTESSGSHRDDPPGMACKIR